MLSVARFAKYSVVGIATFVLDLALLHFFMETLFWHVALAAGVAFLIAVSINYVISRHLVFRGTLRSAHSGYLIFLVITGVGLVAVSGLMTVFVHRFDWNPTVSRVLIAAVVGVWNYLMNLYVNFKVAGVPLAVSISRDARR